MVFLMVVAALVVWALVAAVVAVARDGYGQVPTRPGGVGREGRGT